MCSKYHYLFKYVITGVPKVGKSTFITQFTEQSTPNIYVPTQTVQFASRAVQVNELTVKCQVWDVVMNADESDKGETMKGLGDSLCRKAAAVMLLFDVTNRSSFQRLQKCIREVKAVVNEGTVIAVIGNKTDVEGQRVVSSQESQEFARYHEAVYFETSSFNHKNVEQIFTLVSKMVVDRLSSQEVKLQASGIKRGKMQIENFQQTTPDAINSSWVSVESEMNNFEPGEDSDRMCGAIEEIMQMMKKAKVVQSILSQVKSNIKDKGIDFLGEIRYRYMNSLLSKESTIIQDMFQVFELIQEEFSSHQLHLQRISSVNEELVKQQERQGDIKELEEKCEKLEKKIEQLQVQKGKADQFKENADKRQRDLLAMIDSFKKEKKDIMEKYERQRKELFELENKNMELARELHNLREMESEMKLKQMVQERENSQIMDQLENLQESGVNGELLDKIKKKFTLSCSSLRQDSRLYASSRS